MHLLSGGDYTHCSPGLNTICGGYLALNQGRRRSRTLGTSRRRNAVQGERDPRRLVQLR